MIEIAAWAAYGLSTLVAGRAIAGHFAYAEASKYPTIRANGPQGDDWVWGGFMAFWLAPLWPALLAASGMFRLLSRFPSLKIGAERQKMLQERERRVRDAERELGLEPWQ